MGENIDGGQGNKAYGGRGDRPLFDFIEADKSIDSRYADVYYVFVGNKRKDDHNSCFAVRDRLSKSSGIIYG